MNLSKSKYTRFCQCPKMLWLDTYHPELAVQDEALLRRFREGNEIGELAENSKIPKKCVPGQVRIFLYGREKLPILSLRAEAEKPRRAVRPGFILSRSLRSTHLR